MPQQVRQLALINSRLAKLPHNFNQKVILPNGFQHNEPHHKAYDL
jgi:hypothetical protein